MTAGLQAEGLIVVKALLSDRLMNAEWFSGGSWIAVTLLTECTGCSWIAVFRRHSDCSSSHTEQKVSRFRQPLSVQIYSGVAEWWKKRRGPV